jgi:hypothetical protein
VRHDTAQKAMNEAERLAAKHPGQAFEVLKCVAISQTQKASTFWMDGEDPPVEEKAKWRHLAAWETVEDGDEFYYYSNEWIRVGPVWLGETVNAIPFPIRRRIK